MNTVCILGAGVLLLFAYHGQTFASINRAIPDLYLTRSGCDGDDLDVDCPPGFYIKLEEATYGRTSGTSCSADGEDPVSPDRLPCVASVLDTPTLASCNGNEYCPLRVSADLAADPCSGSTFPKQLNVSYSCIKKTPGQFVCEGETLSIICPDNEVIQVLEVSYGTTDDDRCKDDPNQKFTECYSPDAGIRVTELCNHKRACAVQASEAMFGPTCPGHKKVLSVAYQCGTCHNHDGDDQKCDDYALRGECEANPTWMMAWCRKSCWRCDLTDSCSDAADTEQCTHWASIGECHNNRDWMFTNCQASCNKCHQTATIDDTWQDERWDQPPEHVHDDVLDSGKKNEEAEAAAQRDERRKNRSDRGGDAEGLPLQRYYSVFAIVGTVGILGGMIVCLSFKNKDQRGPYKKSA